MKRMTLLAFAAGGLWLACMPARAAEVPLVWMNPFQYTDGSPLAESDIVSHRIQWTGDCDDFGFVAPENNIVVQGNATARTLEVTPGIRCFRVAVSARDPDTGAISESAWSNPATATVVEPPRVPAAPSNLTVQESAPIAYTIVQSRDRIAVVAVGTADPGTQCDTSQPVLDLWVIPRASVTFAGSVRPEVVLARCG